MQTKTLVAVTRHGQTLLRAFPNATEQDPVNLCRKLRRIETAISNWTVKNCNEGVPDAVLDAETDKAEAKVRALLGITEQQASETGLFVNRDPRGYALKLDDAWVKGYNSTQYREGGLPLHTDFGGYGILAPDLTEQE